MHDVFLSHASEDLKTTYRICEFLEQRGTRCWIDDRDLPKGSKYPPLIIDAINAASIMIVVVSRAAQASDDVLREVGNGEKRGLRLIPFLVEPVDLDSGLSFYVGLRSWIDATEPPIDIHLERLAKEVGASPPLSQVSVWDRRTRGRPAIAVFPFRSVRGDSGDAVLCEAITADLMFRLSRFRTLPLFARPFPDGEDRLLAHAALRRDLGAAYVVEGMLRRNGRKVRINTRLIDAASGLEIWAGSYEGGMHRIFRAQDQMTDEIASEIGVEVLDRERARSIQLDESNLDTWELLVRGDWYARRLDRDSNLAARALYECVIAADPRFAAAFGGAAMTHIYDVLLGWGSDAESSLRSAIELGSRAVNEDERLASAHVALGAGCMLSGELDRALAEMERARELHSAYPMAHWLLGTTLAVMGEPTKALASLQRAMRLSPNDGWMFEFMSSASVACFSGQCYEDAVSYARRSIHRRSDYPPPHYILGAALFHLGRREEADAAAVRARAIDPTHSFPQTARRILGTQKSELSGRFLSALEALSLLA